MVNTSLLALGVAALAVVGLIVTLVALNFLMGIMDWFVGKPKFRILKSEKGANGFAFAFEWDEPKEPARFNFLKIRLFNPFGRPTQAEVSKTFDPQESSFAQDLDMGLGMQTLLKVHGFSDATLDIEVSSTLDGVTHQYNMKGAEFLKLREDAQKTAPEYTQAYLAEEESRPTPAYGVVPRGTVADTVPGKGPQLKIATNPAFAGDFVAAGGGTGADGGGEKKENFAVSKVWIEPGCIVCNACEDIFPEVFEVKADTCVIRPNAPLDDGLKIQEAAEACPVEVIKFNRA